MAQNFLLVGALGLSALALALAVRAIIANRAAQPANDPEPPRITRALVRRMRWAAGLLSFALVLLALAHLMPA